MYIIFIIIRNFNNVILLLFFFNPNNNIIKITMNKDTLIPKLKLMTKRK